MPITDITEQDIGMLRSIEMLDPITGLNLIRKDFAARLRERGVSANAVEGMDIAVQIAFRLGEKYGIQNTVKAMKADNGDTQRPDQ